MFILYLGYLFCFNSLKKASTFGWHSVWVSIKWKHVKH